VIFTSDHGDMLGEMEFVELGSLSLRDWVALTGRERNLFGASTAGLAYRPKERHLVARDAERLVAAIGVTIATVEIAGNDPFEIVGIGSLVVHESARGTGIASELMRRLRPMLDPLGPDRAMLFCRPELMPIYARRDYRPIGASVEVDQPTGPIEMPIPAMWRPLRPCTWPSGRARLHGLPF